MTVTNITQAQSYKAQSACGLAANLPTASLQDVLPGQTVFYLATDTGVLYALAYGDTAWRVFANDGGNTSTLLVPQTKRLWVKRANFNATNGTDIATFAPVLPTGFTRYSVVGLIYSQPSHTMATVSAGLYTGALATGTTIVTAATPAATVTTDGTIHNMDGAATIIDSTSRSFTLAGFPTLYLNLVTQEGAACLADVALDYSPLP
jgi:hypothetical protein